jgi:hypothetical protein
MPKSSSFLGGVFDASDPDVAQGDRITTGNSTRRATT